MNGNNILYRNVKKPDINEIISHIEKVCSKYNIDFDNLKTETAQRFNFCLSQCGIYFFKNTDIFKTVNENRNIIYNINNINEYIEIYIVLCDLYSKVPSILGLCDFISLDYSALMLNPQTNESLKNLNLQRERRLVNNLEDGKKNPVGTIAILNKCYSWDRETKADSDDRKMLSINDLKNILSITQKD